MKKYKNILLTSLLSVASAMGISSCSLINDESDCVDSVNIFEFYYDHNLKFADAFNAEVKSVTLLGFDKSGTLVYARRERQSEMGPDGKSLEVRMKPGKYDFLVWAGDYDEHFEIASAEIGKSKLTDFTCRLQTEATHPDSPNAPENHGHSAKRLEHLFHALVSLDLTYSSPASPARHKIHLTKDTNTVRVMLQQQNAETSIKSDDFIFEITDRNGHLNHDNSKHPDLKEGNVMYHPWALGEGSTEYITGESRAGEANGLPTGQVNVVLAELTTGRLFIDNPTTLTIRRREDGQRLFSIPMIDFALMVKSQRWADMDPQEYLDRQDEFSMTFILDQNQRWIAVEININGWRYIHENVAFS